MKLAPPLPSSIISNAAGSFSAFNQKQQAKKIFTFEANLATQIKISTLTQWNSVVSRQRHSPVQVSCSQYSNQY